MKKLLISSKDISSNGGGERVGVNLANELCKYYELEVVSFFKENENLHFEINSKLKVKYLSNIKAKNAIYKFFMKSIYRYFLSLKLCMFIKKENFDFILANDGFFVPFFKNKHTKYIRLWHLQAPRKKKKIFDSFDDIVVLSTKELLTWEKYHKNITVIPNFLNTIPNKETNLSQKVIISVGRMDRGDQKGFFRLLDIFSLVLDDKSLQEWKLCIVGDGILRKSLEEKATKLGIMKNVEFKNFTKNIEKEYLSASIYAMTSYFEGFGMVLAEACSYGLATLAFDVKSGPSDIINDKESGFLIEDNNIKDFTAKLKILMKDESLRHKFSKNAKKQALKFEKENIIKKWLKILT